MEYISRDYSVTRFGQSENHIWLESLLGMTGGFCGRDEGPLRVRGLISLSTNRGYIDADSLRKVQATFDASSAKLVWQCPRQQITIESCWTFDDQTGVISRKDRLINTGDQPISILRCQAKFTFSPGDYEMYNQKSNWCRENQGHWRPIGDSKTKIACTGGRTCHHATPYLALREKDACRGIAFHLIPQGNWAIEISPESNSVGTIGYPFVVILAGLADEHLHLTLEAGKDFELPEILIQPLPNGRVESAAPAFHRYWIHRLGPSKITPPVFYNTWFNDFENLSLDQCRRQLQTAKALGCESFVVDAGWYGQSEGSWFQQCGDWREKLNGGFAGNLKDFADQVRAAGLEFGIWIEAEIADPIVPVAKDHPDWLIKGNGCLYYDLENPKAYQHLISEITRVIDTYGATYVKIDFNREIGIDPHGTELNGYYRAWYRMLDELHQNHPQVFFEGCASGGMRSDLNAISHFDSHFLSDTVEPIKVLRFFQGAALRLPPGRLLKWVVLRSIGRTIPKYLTPFDQVDETPVVPTEATWDETMTGDIDFTCRIGMLGILGFSGDLSSFSNENQNRIKNHIQWYKEHRSFIIESIYHLLTPVRPFDDRTGWAAIQLENPSSDTGLLFVFRLDDLADSKTFCPVALKTDQPYLVTDIDKKLPGLKKTGSELMTQGVAVTLDKKYQSAVFEIIPQ